MANHLDKMKKEDTRQRFLAEVSIKLVFRSLGIRPKTAQKPAASEGSRRCPRSRQEVFEFVQRNVR